MTTATCPHCGMTLHATRLEFHQPSCPCNPPVRAAILQALADPDQPGVAVMKRDYIKRSAGTCATSANSLFLRYGSWEAICAAFGLAAPVRLACPHCRKPMPSKLMLRKHSAACPHSPEVRAGVRALLEIPGHPGFAHNSMFYLDNAPASLPALSTLREAFGSWDAVCAAVGLRNGNTRRKLDHSADGEEAELSPVDKLRWENEIQADAAREAQMREEAEREAVTLRGLDWHYTPDGRRIPGPRPLPGGGCAVMLR